MLARLCRRTAQVSVVVLGVAWAAAASAEPGLSGNSSSRSGAHNVPNPAPRYAPSPTPLASLNSASLAPGRSYASAPGRSATASAGPNYAPGPVPSNAPVPPAGPTANSISADTPNLVTILSANPAVGPGALSTAATTTPRSNNS